MTEKYGFVYLWFDRKHKRYYVGSHWGSKDDGYVCSSSWMKKAYKIRPEDFKRRIIQLVVERKDLREAEDHWLQMIKTSEIKPTNPKPRYYNLHLSVKSLWHHYPEQIKTIGEKISAAKKGKKTGPRDPSVGKAISKAKKGKAFTEEHKAALAKAQLGTKQSEETKAKRAASLREAWASGRMTGVRGKKLTRQKPSSCTS